MAKIGRNQPCPCGSEKKYKRCHGDPVCPMPLPLTQASMTRDRVEDIKKIVRRREAKEIVRVEQQGEGKPIISAVFKDHRFVAVGRTLHYSKEWKFFPDFLSHFLKLVMDPEWGNLELRKEWADRHPILRWYHDFCLWQQEAGQGEDGTSSAIPTGVVYCYLGLAYGLYQFCAGIMTFACGNKRLDRGKMERALRFLRGLCIATLGLRMGPARVPVEPQCGIAGQAR